MGVNDERAAPVLVPAFDVLADETFEHLGFAGARGAANVEMRRAHRGRHDERDAFAVHYAKFQ